MLILIWLFIIIISWVYYFRDNFFAELVISFLPYIIAAILLIILVLIIILFHKCHSKSDKKNSIKFWTILLIILSCWIGYLYWSEYFSFYNNTNESIRLTQGEWIKVFYANIYYLNDNFDLLQDKLEEEDPDIVILVEFSDEHEEALKDFFREKYQYMNRNSRSTMLAWDVVFSKFPLDNAITTWLSWKWNWKYSYMQINCENNIPNCNDKIDLYVVHTAAPVSMENFEMRNNQLEQLWLDLARNNIWWKPVILIWDFNLSPRSYYYKLLTKNWNLLNALSFQKPNYTRSLREQKIFRSHIDQIFISPEIKISEINIWDLPWSDHRSFIFNVWL